jgi:hypothetical protein
LNPVAIEVAVDAESGLRLSVAQVLMSPTKGVSVIARVDPGPSRRADAALTMPNPMPSPMITMTFFGRGSNEVVPSVMEGDVAARAEVGGGVRG